MPTPDQERPTPMPDAAPETSAAPQADDTAAPDVTPQEEPTTPAAPAAPAAPTAPTAPAGVTTTAPARDRGVRGILAHIALGALAGVAHKVAKDTSVGLERVGKGVETGWSRLGESSPIYQQRLAAQRQYEEQQQRMKLEQQKQLTADEEAHVRTQYYSQEAYATQLKNAAMEKANADDLENDQADFWNWMQNEFPAALSDEYGIHELDKSHAADNAQGKTVPITNGQVGKDAKIRFMSVAQAKSTPIATPYDYTSEWTVDPETGALAKGKPGRMPVDGKITYWDAYEAFKSAQKAGNLKQQQWMASPKGQEVLAAAKKAAAPVKDPVQAALTDPSAVAGEKAVGIIPQIQSVIDDPATDPARKAQAQRALTIAKAALKGQEDLKAREEAAKQAAAQGDPKAAGKALYEGSLTIADLKARQTSANFITQSVEEADRIARAAGGRYNASDEIVGERVLGQAGSQTFFGSAHSLLGAEGTLNQLLEAAKSIPRNQYPVANKLADWASLQTGKGPLSGFAATLLGIADDYGKVMGGGSATDAARHSAEVLAMPFSSPEQLRTAIDHIRNSVISQVRSRIGTNRYIMQREGYDLPAEMQIIRPTTPPPVTPPARAPGAITAPGMPQVTVGGINFVPRK